jgi:type III secretion system YscD/HrpQ family protein
MNPKLIAEDGDLKGTVLTLEDAESWVIGRDPEECQFILQDPSTSRKHLLCYKTAEGIVAENLSQTNPVLVNEEELSAPRLLQEGDKVKIGNELFRFYTDVSSHMTENHEKQAKKVLEGSLKPMEDVEEIKEESADQELNEAQREPEHAEPEYVEPEHDSIFEESIEGEKHQIAEINFGVTETGRWLLKVIGGSNSGAEFYMQSPQNYIIGTDPLTCDIVFHDISVSRQHARITVNVDDTLSIEDLNSRNGILVNGDLIKEKQILQPSIVVAMGTTSFVVYDREGEMQTIISPLLPSIVKVLQKEDAASIASAPPASNPIPEAAADPSKEEIAEKKQTKMSHFILLAILSVILIVTGIGTTTLFREQPIKALVQENAAEQVKQLLKPFPAIQFSFNKGTGGLLLIGHVNAASEKTELMYNLKGLKFIKFVDDSGIIIDEYVRTEMNQILNNNPAWRGISIHSPVAGQFIITGYLETRKQAEQLSDYLSVNFRYVDLLQQNVVVEEDIINRVNAALDEGGLREIKVQMSNGEISFTGSISVAKGPAFEKVLSLTKDMTGVRAVKNFVSSLTTESGIINISDRYEVSGLSNLGEGKYSVVVNGKFLSVGDALDGMTITKIRPNVISLEQGNTQYRIDFQ